MEFPEFNSPRIFPAIDVRAGRCVRLVRGARDAELRYEEDPVKVALRWEAQGAECLHVVDLGAALGERDSGGVVLEIVSRVRIPVQTGGGIRDESQVATLLGAGVGRVILGTRAFRDLDFLRKMVGEHGPGRVVVAMDCEGERVKIAGWEEESPLGIEAALEQVTKGGADRLLVTATDRDGTLSGSRVDLVTRIHERSAARVVAAGGIGTLDHVRELLQASLPRLEGVVVGRALYEGTVSLKDALELAKQKR
jgi:phosphoribosylformimino-5-aminoimidazole carboxamide ribotide isomerase